MRSARFYISLTILVCIAGHERAMRYDRRTVGSRRRSSCLGVLRHGAYVHPVPVDTVVVAHHSADVRSLSGCRAVYDAHFGFEVASRFTRACLVATKQSADTGLPQLRRVQLRSARGLCVVQLACRRIRRANHIGLRFSRSSSNPMEMRPTDCCGLASSSTKGYATFDRHCEG